MRLLTALLCACVLPAAASVQYSVDCREFYAAVASYVDCGGQCPDMVTVDDCAKSGLVHKMLLYEDSMNISNATVVYNLQGDAPALARLLVFAAIGRHFARQPGVTTPHFRWDAYTDTLALNRLSCEFQRPLYGFILIVTLLVVVVAVGMHLTVVRPPSPVPSSGAGGHAVYDSTKDVLAPMQALSFRGATKMTQS